MLIWSTFFKFLVFWPDPTHQPTHQTIHPPMGGEFLTDFKSSNRIEISWLVQVLLNFYWFWGSTPLGGGGWVDGVGVGMGVGGMSHAHMHTHTCMLNMINMLNMDASMSAAICNFYTCIHVCVQVCACTCMWEHLPHVPRCPQTPPTHLPPPQSWREPKMAKFNKSWTNRDNLFLFEDSLPLNILELI